MNSRQNLALLRTQYRALLYVGPYPGCLSSKGFIKKHWKFIFQAITACYVHYCMILYSSDKTLKLIRDINLLATKANPSERKVWVFENRRAEVIPKVYAGTCLAAVTFSATIPIFTMIYEYLQGIEIHQKLPYDGQFLYEDRGYHIFILNYILSVMYVFIFMNLTICLPDHLRPTTQKKKPTRKKQSF